MVFKHFRFVCVLRVALLTLTILGFIYLLTETSLFATTLIVGVVGVYQVWSLIHYIEKTNRDLQHFLLSIRHADFYQSFSAGKSGGSFGELYEAFNEVMEEFHRTRSLAEERMHYMRTIVQHIGVGLVAFGSEGNIDLINPAARRLLGVGAVRDLGAIAAEYPGLVDAFYRLRQGHKKLLKIQRADEGVQLSLEATEFKQRDRVIKLVSMQDVTGELAEREMEAWQKLVRVLTHEIMNSVTPIASLAGTVDNLLAEPKDDEKSEPPDDSVIEDIRSAAQTIQRRSQGLVQFIEAYRSLTRIPQPNFQIVPVRDLFRRAQRLAAVDNSRYAIELVLNVEPESLELTADQNLVEQVLINLINNAKRALRAQEDGRVELRGRLGDRGRVILQVIDNGPGITPEVLDKVFIPFFSTNPDGTGIGLSLSRQIMRMHKGDLSVVSEPNKRTVFTMRF